MDDILDAGDDFQPLPPAWVVFDTETTGLFDFKKPADDPAQPRLASVAFILCDAAGRELSAARHYIRPDGWEMPHEARAINGLTTEFLTEFGQPVAEVLDIWNGFVDQGLPFAAFNAQFDAKMMRAELRRAGRPDRFEETRQTCLMRSLQPYGEKGLPIMRGFVKLKEAREFFRLPASQAHEVMADARDARALLEILIRDGHLLEPKVHYAKDRP